MKTTFFNFKNSLLGVVILSGAILLSGCSKDEDVNPVDRKQFAGSYQVEDMDLEDGYIEYYSISITESSKGKDLIEISNFGDLMNVNIFARVKGNKFTIYSQSFDSSDKSYKMTLTGEGTISGSTITFSYNFFVNEKFDEDWSFGSQCVATKIG